MMIQRDRANVRLALFYWRISWVTLECLDSKARNSIKIDYDSVSIERWLGHNHKGKVSMPLLPTNATLCHEVLANSIFPDVVAVHAICFCFICFCL